MTLIPDAEALLGAYLNAHADVTALGARAAGRTPGNLTSPWIRVTQLAATDIGEDLEHLIEHMVQLDCYAGKAAMDAHTGQAEANTLARTVRAALKELEDEQPDGIDVNRVRFVGMARIPDQDFEPARERVVLTTEVVLHP